MSTFALDKTNAKKSFKINNKKEYSKYKKILRKMISSNDKRKNNDIFEIRNAIIFYEHQTNQNSFNILQYSYVCNSDYDIFDVDSKYDIYIENAQQLRKYKKKLLRQETSTNQDIKYISCLRNAIDEYEYKEIERITNSSNDKKKSNDRVYHRKHKIKDYDGCDKDRFNKNVY